MRNMKLKTAIAVAAIGSVALAQAAVVWTGGTGDWSTGANWAGGVVPDTSGTDDAQISTGGIATYVPGGDLWFDNGSDLILDGGTFRQANNGDWFHVNKQSKFTITDGGLLDVSIANNVEIKGRATGTATFTMDNGTLLMKKGQIDDLRFFEVSNGSTITVAQNLNLNNSSYINLTDSTLNVRDLALNAYAGNETFIHLNNGAQVNLLNTTSLGTNVITKAGDSMVNFALDSTGVVFIDNLALSELEAMVGQEKFGIDGTIDTNLVSYVIVADGAGQKISLIEPPPEEIGSIDIAYDGSDIIITWGSSAGQDYDVQSKSNLVTQVDWLTIDSVIGSGGSMSVTTAVGQAESFYQVVTP